MSDRNNLYSQVMLRHYGKGADTGAIEPDDLAGSYLAWPNEGDVKQSKTERLMMALGGVGGGLLLGALLSEDWQRRKDFLGFGATALGVSILYFGHKDGI